MKLYTEAQFARAVGLSHSAFKTWRYDKSKNIPPPDKFESVGFNGNQKRPLWFEDNVNEFIPVVKEILAKVHAPRKGKVKYKKKIDPKKIEAGWDFVNKKLKPSDSIR